MILYLKKNGKYFPLVEGKPTEEINFGFVLGEEGLYQTINSFSYSVIKKTTKIPNLDSIEEETTYNFPTISYEVYSKVLAFLRAVYKEHKSEGTVLLILNRNKPLENQEYRIAIPKQEVTGTSVNYNNEEIKNTLKDGDFFAGSIHSHPDFNASQSGIDHADEHDFDGVHITLGQIMKDPVQVHSRICLNGEVYDKLSAPIIKTVPNVKEVEVPKEWLELVSKKNYKKQQNIGYPQFWQEQREDGIWITKSYKNIPKRYTSVKLLREQMKPKSPINQRSNKTLNTGFAI